MALPGSGQTVHMMTLRDVLGVLWKMHRQDGRNVAELHLYTTDDLRQFYRTEKTDTIQLRDGIINRVELVAVIRWRIFCARFGYVILLFVSVIAAVASVIAAVEGWR